MNSPRAPRRAPFWFELCAVVVFAVVVRWLTPPHTDPSTPQLAFWGILLSIVGAIWNGVHAVADGVVATLVVSVRLLWSFAGEIFNGARQVAEVLRAGMFKAWDFFKATYDNVLKPAWDKIWKLVDRVRATLERILNPVITFLRHIRDELIGFYTHWIRPVLDTIDVARKWLHVLTALHVPFAAALDRKLADIEAAIDRPFRFLLAEINKAINLVNRVVDANGLFQRLALVRSIERDMGYIHREFLNAWHRPLTDDDRRQITDANEPKSFTAITSDVRQYLVAGDGPDAALVDELAAQARINLRAA